jgi:hypothetical protein
MNWAGTTGLTESSRWDRFHGRADSADHTLSARSGSGIPCATQICRSFCDVYNYPPRDRGSGTGRYVACSDELVVDGKPGGRNA